MKAIKKPHGELTEEGRKAIPLYPIGVMAELAGITEQTLRLYEKHDLITPARRNKNRYYSENDINWLKCLRDLIHIKKISIEGIKKLLDYAPCWEINDCPEERRQQCSAYIDRSKPCWEMTGKVCNGEGKKRCKECVVYISRAGKRKASGKAAVAG
ncbi:MAG: MerR family transcriptional regulator [Nitrospirae bacterium]|nr:MerR family transcriptional regulator [Nitrospirota bacterium]